AVAAVAGELGQVVDAAGEVPHRGGQLAARCEVAADAVGLLDRQRVVGLPTLGQLERLVGGVWLFGRPAAGRGRGWCAGVAAGGRRGGGRRGGPGEQRGRGGGPPPPPPGPPQPSKPGGKRLFGRPKKGGGRIPPNILPGRGGVSTHDPPRHCRPPPAPYLAGA